MPIITRFAPSPTGVLHLGGARTALFNFLYAKKNNGKFKLRIEDTDKDRNSENSTNSITSSLNWLNIKNDGEIVFQSQNINEHINVVNSLISKGLAYKCYHDKEYLKKAALSKTKFVSEWRNKQDKIPKEGEFCIRIKSPLDGTVNLNDKIQGKIKVNANEIDDYVILRSDGSPTFLLSSAVDDFNMEVTDIIRGDDHLTNSLRQKIIFEFLEYYPNFSHIPLIFNENNQKMSKRDNTLSINDYKKNGYTPEAINNYLIRLGWSHGNEEIFSLEYAKEIFSLKKIGKSPARFDNKKLNYLNNHYIKTKDGVEILNLMNNLSKEFKETNFFSSDEKLELVNLFKDRAISLKEIISNIYDLTLIKKEFDKEQLEIINDFKKYKKYLLIQFSDIIKWNEENIEKIIRNVIESNNLPFKTIAKPLRLLVTGALNGPSIYKLLKIIGQKETIKRIK